MKRLSGFTADSRGFTIIESLLVLAAGGIILSLIFMALPAVQRNSRNGERRQDAANLLLNISRFSLTNSGAFPSTCETYSGSNPPCAATLTRKLTFYATNNVWVQPDAPATTNLTSNVLDPAAIVVTNYHRCKTDGSGTATSVGAGYRDAVALFKVETGGSTQIQCLEN